MKKITVRLKGREYPIFVGAKLGGVAAFLKKKRLNGSLFIITNTTVAKLYLSNLLKAFKKNGFKVKHFIIPDGEQYKNIETLEKIYAGALKSGVDRSSCVIALGGGVVGDIAGFFSSSYMRGLPYVQIPTTLLAMVDASIGGKTGVDLKEGKNLVGSFYQPKAVWIDTSVLKTLPERQIRNGLAEVIKYGVIADPGIFGLLEKRLSKGVKGIGWEAVIFRCAKIKAEVVEIDEFETKGLREILNFGHTFGHAIETLSGYKKYLHGEAVAIGMLIASRLASIVNKFSGERRIERLISLAGLPTKLKERWPSERILSVMAKDKKSKGGKNRIVLPLEIGKAAVYSDISKNLLREVLR